MSFVIQDWTGNQVVTMEFDTFEDAWGFIYGELTDKLGLKEDDYQEYFVVEKERVAA